MKRKERKREEAKRKERKGRRRNETKGNDKADITIILSRILTEYSILLM